MKCTLPTVSGQSMVSRLSGTLENGLFHSVWATFPPSPGNTHLALLCSDTCIFQRHTKAQIVI